MIHTAVAAGPGVAQATLPWGAWYGDGQHTLPFPAGWSVRMLAPPPRPELTDDQITAALLAPVGSPPLHELARGKRSAVVVTDDLARPTPAARLLPPMLESLAAAGIDAQRTTLLIATGAHGPPPRDKLADKLGRALVDRYRVECHDPHGALVDAGIRYGAGSLEINATFAAADLKVSLGCVLPHAFAGYSGGAKMLLPGLTDLQAAERAHKFVQLGLRGGHDCDQNRFRLEAEAVARQLGLQFSVCTVTGLRRQLTAVYAGDVVASHRRAADDARAAGNTPLPGRFDALVLNAFPKDVNLVQSAAALVSLRRLTEMPVAEHGVVVLTTAASEGVGRHDLFGPEGRSARAPAPLRQLAGRPLWIYAPGLTLDEVRQLYPAEYRHFQRSTDLCEALRERLGTAGSAGVVPAAAMQELFAA